MNRLHQNQNRLKILSDDWGRWPMKKSWIPQTIRLSALCVSLLILPYSPQSASAQCEEDDPDQVLSSVEFQELEELRRPGDLMLNEEVLGGLSPERYLRALTLDLLGRVPTIEEYDALEAQGGHVTESQLTDWLASPEFATQATRYHRGLLWNNVSNLNLYNGNARISANQNIWWRRQPSQRYRGARVRCLDEPARFDDDGNILTTWDEENEANREGWVWVSPYWDPDTQIRVCAIDAQEDLFSSEGIRCDTNQGMSSADCGCGPQLEWCASNQTAQMMTRSLAESLDRFINWTIAQGDSYIDLFESPRFFINGPLAHFFRHHTRVGRYSFNPSPIPEEMIPNINYNETERWVPMILPSEHAGILTHPAFLMRFQTNRARANRFFDAFLCSPFQPPEGGLPVADEASVRNPDLQQRAGCKYCHALLEPAASYWGRWTEQGIAYLNPIEFPRERQDCLSCAQTGQGCSGECRTFYLTQSLSEQEIPYLGQLRAYSFRRAEHEVNVERGPKLLAFSEVTDQRLPRCVAKRSAEWLLGRSVDTHKDRAWLDALGIRFARNGFDYGQLISDIVKDVRYRRVK
jgi:hypothetical protein